MQHHTTKDFLENYFDEVRPAQECLGSTDMLVLLQVPVDLVVNMTLAHTAAGTLGPVHANTISRPCTGRDVFGHVLDLLPEQQWRKDISIEQMRGVAKAYKVRASSIYSCHGYRGMTAS